ncbi:MBL fold metallo-hydrolase [Candidatus Bipolaricaulota bacterium]|nr:MBL fold metallo-hydrolase [Candidatus Bipolaricaulota bacterium]
MEVIPIRLGTVKSFLLVGNGSDLILVDAGNPGDGGKIVEKVQTLGYRLKDVSLIVLTHGHRDHVGGVAELTKALSAKVVIHERDSQVLSEGKDAPTTPARFTGRLLKPFATDKKFPLPEDEPDRIKQSSVSLKCFGIDGEIIHTPGHTFGSLSVVSENGIAVVGDLIMGKFIVFGRASLPIFAEDLPSVKDSIKRVLSAGPKRIYSSHGGPFTPEDLERLV